MKNNKSASKQEVTQNIDVQQREDTSKKVALNLGKIKIKDVMHPDNVGKELVLDVKKDGKSYIFYGEPDNRAPAVEFRHVLAPGGAGPEPHIHTKQTETFHIISGIMVASLKGQKDVRLGPGEMIDVPPGIVHSFTNGSKEEPLVLRIVIEPALDFQWFMTEAIKSGIRNGGSQKDMPLLEAGHLMWLSRDQQRIGGMPYVMQDILFGILSLFARITGSAKNISTKPQ